MLVTGGVIVAVTTPHSAGTLAIVAEPDSSMRAFSMPTDSPAVPETRRASILTT